MEKEVKDMLNNVGNQDKNEAQLRSEKMKAISFAPDEEKAKQIQL